MNFRAAQVDRRYNDWHYSLSRRCRYMDLDGVEFDRYSKPLALIETTTNPEKITTVMCVIARRCKVPAYLVILPAMPEPLTAETVVTVRQVSPVYTVRRVSLAAWGEFIENLHAQAERATP